MNNVHRLRPETALRAIENLRESADNQRHVPPAGGGGEPPMELSERVIRVEEKLSGVDKRLALVETDLRALTAKLDSHFLVLGGMVLSVAIGLAGLMAKGFDWL